MTEETCEILRNFGYQFEQRGLVTVKGKGQLMTYYLLGKASKLTPPTAPVSPHVGPMETVNEEDESPPDNSVKSDDRTIIDSQNPLAQQTMIMVEDDEVFTNEVGVVAVISERQTFANNKEAEPLLLSAGQ